MKTNIKNILKASLLSAFAFLSVGCNTDPEYYSTVAPEIFFTSQETVWQRYMRPFTHWKWHFGTNDHHGQVQMLGTDELCLPTRNGDWYNGGTHQNEHHHIYRTSEGVYHNNFYGVGMGVALAYDALHDIEEYVDFEALKFPEGTKESMVAQLNILIAHLYKDGLDKFGGMNLYTRELFEAKEVVGRSTDVETFEFVEKLLKDNISALPKKQNVDDRESTQINQAFAATLLAQLYFNAVPYTKGAKGEMWAECAKICEDILDGVYGPYKLGEQWNSVFKWDNYTCGEIIYGIPSDANYSGADCAYWNRWWHYNTKNYMGGATYGDWNGYAIQPSYAPDGRMYTEEDWKLGRVMSKFHDDDLRKQPYCYLGNGEFTGMFLMGQQVSPSPRNPAGAGQTGEFKNNQWTGWVGNGAREYQGRILYINDCIARFAYGNQGADGITAHPEQAEYQVYDWDKDGNPIGRVVEEIVKKEDNKYEVKWKTYKDEDGKEQYVTKPIDRSKLGFLSSTIADAEEASGIRMIKYSPVADKIDYDNKQWRMPAMYPVARLAEIYYMLAECYTHMNKYDEAADLINTVRARNFEGEDPQKLTGADLQGEDGKYRLADEWLVEFLCEKRRRTDLIRWGMYVHENWWDHEASHNENWNRFPISDKSISANNLLEQNPGY